MSLKTYWKNYIDNNIQNNKPWYFGIEGDWWHGMDEEQFITEAFNKGKPHLIIAAGARRSGSTWQYNTIRIALEEAGCSVYGTKKNDYDPNSNSNADFHVIKTHDYYPELKDRALFIFTIIRDIDSVIKSNKRINWVLSRDEIYNELNDGFKWMKWANCIQSYSFVKYDNIKATQEIIDILGIDVNAEELSKKVDELKQPVGNVFFTGWDKTTLLHPFHRP